MGRRGEAWVVAQAVLLLLIAFAPHIGLPWPQLVAVQVAGGLLAVAGGLLLFWSALNLGHSLTPFPRPLADGKLVTSGAYRLVRHPIYLALLLATLGLSLATANWLRLVLTGVLFVFFDSKARREEQWLQQQYPGYAAYKSRVRRLIPWIY